MFEVEEIVLIWHPYRFVVAVADNFVVVVEAVAAAVVEVEVEAAVAVAVAVEDCSFLISCFRLAPDIWARAPAEVSRFSS